MKQRWQRIRPVMWTLTPIVGVAMLFLLPWLVREVRPLSSDALFQEARAESPGEYTILPAHLWGMYAPYQAHSNPFRIRIAAR